MQAWAAFAKCLRLSSGVKSNTLSEDILWSERPAILAHDFPVFWVADRLNPVALPLRPSLWRSLSGIRQRP